MDSRVESTEKNQEFHHGEHRDFKPNIQKINFLTGNVQYFYPKT